MLFEMHRARSLIDILEIDTDTKKSMVKAFTRRIDLSGDNIYFFNEPFTPVSLTGTHCSLRCKHCNSYYLDHMKDGSSGKLYALADHLASGGAKGILLSGGSSPDGRVPTYEMADVIQKIKRDMNLKISAHTGIVNPEYSQALSTYLDMALVMFWVMMRPYMISLGLMHVLRIMRDPWRNCLQQAFHLRRM